MATALLAVFEEKLIEICVELDPDAIDDLRKPEKITSPGGRVSIAATRNEAGHADHFWAMALAIRDAEGSAGPVAFSPVIIQQVPLLQSRLSSTMRQSVYGTGGVL